MNRLSLYSDAQSLYSRFSNFGDESLPVTTSTIIILF